MSFFKKKSEKKAKVEKTSTEKTKVEKKQVEKTKTEKTKVEETKVEKTKVEETQVEKIPNEKTPTEKINEYITKFINAYNIFTFQNKIELENYMAKNSFEYSYNEKSQVYTFFICLQTYYCFLETQSQIIHIKGSKFNLLSGNHFSADRVLQTENKGIIKETFLYTIEIKGDEVLCGTVYFKENFTYFRKNNTIFIIEKI